MAQWLALPPRSKNDVFRFPPTVQKHTKLENLNCLCDCEWLLVSRGPCEELTTHPGCTPPSPKDCWDKLQLTPVKLYSGTSEYRR